MKIKYQIKKYRSILDQSIEVEFGKISYFIGGNESGKSNILKAIDLMGANTTRKYIQKQDETKLASWFVNSKDHSEEKENFTNLSTSFTMTEGSKELKVSIGGEHFWLTKNSSSHNELKKLFESQESNFGNIAINRPEYASLINQIKVKIKDTFIPFEDLAQFMAIPELEKDFLDKIKIIYSNAKITAPATYLIQPHDKASKTEKLEYRIADINRANSQIRAIFSCFGEKQQLAKLYNQSGSEIDRSVISERKSFIDYLNTSICEYFDNFSFIKATPKLVEDGGVVYLNIEEKDGFKYEIHTDDENERSFGFKYYSRLILEIKSICETTPENERVVYMIDEPEQSLHPLLQKELVKEIKNIIKDKENVAVIMATHSMYSFDLKDNLFFVERSRKTNLQFFGATIISKCDEKSLIKEDNDLESDFIKRLIFDKRKSLLIKDEELKKLYSSQNETEKKWVSGEISWCDYIEELHNKDHNFMDTSEQSQNENPSIKVTK